MIADQFRIIRTIINNIFIAQNTQKNWLLKHSEVCEEL